MGHKASIFRNAAVIEVQRHMESAVQRHARAWVCNSGIVTTPQPRAVVVLWWRERTMRQARSFLSGHQVWPSKSRCTRSATRREWYRASTRARRQAKFDWTKDAPISDRRVLEKYQEHCGTRPSAKPRGAPHEEQNVTLGTKGCNRCDSGE